MVFISMRIYNVYSINENTRFSTNQFTPTTFLFLVPKVKAVSCNNMFFLSNNVLTVFFPSHFFTGYDLCYVSNTEIDMFLLPLLCAFLSPPYLLPSTFWHCIQATSLLRFFWPCFFFFAGGKFRFVRFTF
uniref:(northern house mosquito) hypothetical protein n=1 Tax=Culex pipiens TaxID=7175 RepID=A0A8D8BV95_CULPI